MRFPLHGRSNPFFNIIPWRGLPFPFFPEGMGKGRVERVQRKEVRWWIVRFRARLSYFEGFKLKLRGSSCEKNLYSAWIRKTN